MAGPVAGLSAAQIAQQKLQDQGAQQVNKQGPSKFDQAMQSKQAGQAEKAGQVKNVAQVEQAQAAQKAQQAQRVQQPEQVNKTEKARLDKIQSQQHNDPVAQKSDVSKSTGMMSNMVGSIEKGQVALDKLIKDGLAGKKFDNGELLALQASMYKYTQELELTGKVVEKATTGLKDTLKTQV